MTDPMLTSSLQDAANRRDRILKRLGRGFPNVGDVDLDDAVQHALLAAAESPQAFLRAVADDGDGGLRWLVVVGWRHLRGEFRRFSTRKRDPFPADDVLPDPWPSPAALAESRQDLDRAGSLLDEAAARHGPACEKRLRDALLVRIAEEETDANAARRHGVPREYVNRARRWMSDRMRAA